MYLPLGFSTNLLRFLPLPFLLSNSDQADLLNDHWHHHHHDCEDSACLGNLSPYHPAPPVHKVFTDLPDDCAVNQVILLHRHGSRGPAGEEGFIIQLVNTLDKAKDAIHATDLPHYLHFLKEGYKYNLVPEELTVVGRRELFDHGAQFAIRYPNFTTNEVVSTTVQRVIDSAHFFGQGFFGRGADDITYLTTNNFTDPVSWIVPWESCPKLSYLEPWQVSQEWAERYIPRIMDRLNELVPGVGFTFKDVQGALYACPYDLATREESPWCHVFSGHDLQGLEYQIDLFFDGYSGHASKGDPGPLVGAFYIKKLIERLTDTSANAKPLYLDFGHDFSILFALSTLGLNKDDEPLSPFVHRPPADRKFSTSRQTPFAAQMVWEKFTCTNSFDGPQVRLVLNEATFPLSICQQSWNDRRYGTCSLEAFVEANKFSTSVEYHSKTWNDTCEVVK